MYVRTTLFFYHKINPKKAFETFIQRNKPTFHVMEAFLCAFSLEVKKKRKTGKVFSFFPKNVIINFCRGNSVGRFLLPLANATSCLKNNGAKTFSNNFISFFPTGNIVAWKVQKKNVPKCKKTDQFNLECMHLKWIRKMVGIFWKRPSFSMWINQYVLFQDFSIGHPVCEVLDTTDICFGMHPSQKLFLGLIFSAYTYWCEECQNFPALQSCLDGDFQHSSSGQICHCLRRRFGRFSRYGKSCF